jgi:hypothetical protein
MDLHSLASPLLTLVAEKVTWLALSALTVYVCLRFSIFDHLFTGLAPGRPRFPARQPAGRSEAEQQSILSANIALAVNARRLCVVAIEEPATRTQITTRERIPALTRFARMSGWWDLNRSEQAALIGVTENAMPLKLVYLNPAIQQTIESSSLGGQPSG